MVAYSFSMYYIYTIYPYIIFRKELNLTIQKMTLNAVANPSALRVTCLLPNVTYSVTFRLHTRCTYFWYSDKLYIIQYVIYIHKYVIYTVRGAEAGGILGVNTPHFFGLSNPTFWKDLKMGAGEKFMR